MPYFCISVWRLFDKAFLPRLCLSQQRPSGLTHGALCSKTLLRLLCAVKPNNSQEGHVKELKSKIENTNPSLTPTKPQSWSNVPLTFPYEKLKELGHCWCKSPVGQRQGSQFEKCVSTFFWFGFCLVFLGFFISTSWPTRENITSVQRFTHFPSFKI